MIYGQCPYCGEKTVEARVSRRGNKDVQDPKGSSWKTKCSACNRFIGYRPVEVRR